MTQKAPKSWSSSFSSLVIPLAIGLGMYMCLCLMIDREVITNELLLRYLTGHPISRITAFMFCVGIAGLLVIANNVFDQFCNCDKIRLTTENSDNGSEEEGASANLSRSQRNTRPAEEASVYLDQLFEFGRSVRSHYMWQRLYQALSYINRTDGSSGIEDELKYLADIDHDRQQRRYSLVRIVIWATPMLGFLGTVLGISQALGGIQVGPDNDFQTMLNGLRGSLFVAFDTTALALTLSMLMMFLMFFVDRFELQLLETVQRRANEELLPLYKDNVFVDSQTRAIERIGRTVLATSHGLVKQQADQWQESMHSAETAWTNTVSSVSETVRQSLAESLRLANVELADSITQGVDRADASMAKRWEQWQVLLSENARHLSDSQRQVVAQMELIDKIINKIENANGAQQMLNQNLDTLAATSQLHSTLQSLSESVNEIRNQARVSDNQQRPGLRIHRQSVVSDNNGPTPHGREHQATRKSA